MQMMKFGSKIIFKKVQNQKNKIFHGSRNFIRVS